MRAACDGVLDEATLTIVRARSACHLYSRDMFGRSMLHWLATRNDVALVNAALADGALSTSLLSVVDDFGSRNNALIRYSVISNKKKKQKQKNKKKVIVRSTSPCVVERLMLPIA